MIVTTHNGSSYDRHLSISFNFFHVVDHEITIDDRYEIGDLSKFVERVITQTGSDLGYVVVPNVLESDDILASKPGISSGKYVIVTSLFTACFYTSKTNRTHIIKSAKDVKMNVPFQYLSPTTYRSTCSSRMLGANPSSYVCVGDYVFESYPSDIKPVNLPDCDFAYLNGMRIQALYGCTVSGIGVDFIRRTNMASAKSVLYQDFGKSVSYKLSGDLGVSLRNNTARARDFDNFLQGLEINPTQWSYKTVKQLSAALSGLFSFSFVRLVDDPYKHCDSLVFMSNTMDGRGLQEFVNGEAVDIPVYTLSVSDELQDILDTYDIEVSELKAKGNELALSSLSVAIQEFCSIQDELITRYEGMALEAGEEFECASVEMDKSLIPVTSLSSVNADSNFYTEAQKFISIGKVLKVSSEDTEITTSFGNYAFKSPHVSFDKAKFVEAMHQYISKVHESIKDLLTPLTLTFRWGLVGANDITIEGGLDNAKKYYHNHGAGQKCNGLYSIYGLQENWINAGTSGEYTETGILARITSLSDFLMNWRVCLNDDDVLIQTPYDKSFKYTRLQLFDNKIENGCVKGRLCVDFETMFTGAVFGGADFTTVRENFTRLMRSFCGHVFAGMNPVLSCTKQISFIVKGGTSDKWFDAAHCSEMENEIHCPQMPNEGPVSNTYSTLFPIQGYRLMLDVCFKIGDFSLLDDGVFTRSIAKVTENIENLQEIALMRMIERLERYDLSASRLIGMYQDLPLSFKNCLGVSCLRLSDISLDKIKKLYSQLLSKRDSSNNLVLSIDSPARKSVIEVLSELDLVPETRDYPWFIEQLDDSNKEFDNNFWEFFLRYE